MSQFAENDFPIPDYVSHKTEDRRYETVRDHLQEVADMAAEFATPFNSESWAYLAGLAHDIGKYSQEFQDRILHDGNVVDHSTAGAFELYRRSNNLSPLAYAVAGHHGGLPDGGSTADYDGKGTLLLRIQKAEQHNLPSYEAFKREVSFPSRLEGVGVKPLSQSGDDISFTISFFTRMIFSCLVDADYLCTERFMNGQARQRSSEESLEVLRDRLEEKISPFYPPKTPLNQARCSILDDCKEASVMPRGFFSLTVPTGGGKTYASMRFALNHALSGSNDMRRVIYAVPYTSIIEQNADVYRSVFGANNVLEHHANFDFDTKSLGIDEANRLRLAAENWDVPIVVTTNVQFFESLYGNKPSRCRKLHNIAKSVIVLDEAQMLPTKQLLPCVRALVELVANYGCSVVLCTATQPALNGLLESYGKEFVPHEIIPHVEQLYTALKRVSYRSLPPQRDDQLAARLEEHRQVLCIVNSRKEAKNLYDLLCSQDDEGIYHLSTLMYPIHRRKVLAEIRQRLKSGQSCRVIATSLIEAGVDVDFPVVYRELNGIDSMIQAAGRCNRENNLMPEDAPVYIFESAEDYRLPADSKQKASISRKAVEKDAFHLDTPDVIEAYFSELYDIRSQNLDSKRVLERSKGARAPFDFEFKEIAESFQMIEDGSIPVIISSDQNAEDIEALKLGVANRDAMRRLSQYSVGVYENHLKNLLQAGSVERIKQADELFVLVDPESYGEKTGLAFKGETGDGVFW